MSVKVDPSYYKETLLNNLEKNLRINLSFISPYMSLENFEKIPSFMLEGFLKDNYIEDFDCNHSFHKFHCLNTTIVGAGGVASWFLPQYIKTIYNYKEKNGFNVTFNIYLIDNDRVEEKNLLRQNFIPEDVGKNKAEVLAERYHQIYPDINVYAIPYYYYSSRFISKEAFCPLEIRGQFDTLANYKSDSAWFYSDIIINTLDNEFTKHMLDYDLSLGRSKWYFSAGCHPHGGTITALKTTFDYYSVYYKDETFVEDGGEIETFSCAELAEQATVEQTFDSNSFAANLLNLVINNYISDPFYCNKRISFDSTGTPYTQVLEENVSLKYSRFKVVFNQQLRQLWGYLRIRNYKFARSPKGKAFMAFRDQWQPYIDINSLIEEWEENKRFISL